MNDELALAVEILPSLAPSPSAMLGLSLTHLAINLQCQTASTLFCDVQASLSLKFGASAISGSGGNIINVMRLSLRICGSSDFVIRCHSEGPNLEGLQFLTTP
jgi:hypothetical protein